MTLHCGTAAHNYTLQRCTNHVLVYNVELGRSAMIMRRQSRQSADNISHKHSSRLALLSSQFQKVTDFVQYKFTPLHEQMHMQINQSINHCSVLLQLLNK